MLSRCLFGKFININLMAQKVRTGFAPSPTGFLHIGGIRTALYELLWARKNNGTYILRIEDTDQSRAVEGGLENIVKSLADLNLNADEGFYWDNGVKTKGNKAPYVQSERLGIYKKYAKELIDKKVAYYCFCSQERLQQLRKDQEAQKLPPKYDKHCLNLKTEELAEKLKNNEPHIIRLNVVPGEIITFKDDLHGEISVPSKDLDDQVLLKSDGFPTYHLEWLSTTISWKFLMSSGRTNGYLRPRSTSCSTEPLVGNYQYSSICQLCYRKPQGRNYLNAKSTWR